MFKKLAIIGVVTAFVLSIGVLTFAQNDTDNKENKSDSFKHGHKGNAIMGMKAKGQMDDELLANIAEKLNITVEKLKDAVTKEREDKLINQAKELGIETKGKTSEELRKEIAEKQEEISMSNIAKTLNISAEDFNKVFDEVKETRFLNQAEKMGIETEGKTVEEIKEELASKREDFRANKGFRKGMSPNRQMEACPNN